MVGASEAERREGVERRERIAAAMIEDALELGGGLRPSPSIRYAWPRR